MNGLAPRLSPGVRASLPVVAFLFIGFVAPLLMVVGFSFMPARTFSLAGDPTFANYATIFDSTNYISLLWSLGLAVLTVLFLIVISYPVAYGLVRVFGRWTTLVTLLFVIPLFVSENVRLYGWVLFFIKNGVLLGTIKSMFGIELESMLFTRSAIVLGMVYVYLPFMLFPLTLGISMVPNETREAALDLGATRWQVFREVELPLSMPGLVIGLTAKVGDMLAKGDPILQLEAMKMQASVVADRAGKLTAVHVKVGDSVERKDLVAEIT